MECGMGTALGTAHLIAAFEEEQKVWTHIKTYTIVFSFEDFHCFTNYFSFAMT